jgi:hypothetical protein
MANYGFTLQGVNLPATTELLSVWSIPARATSFDVNAPAEPTTPTWRIDLPDSIDEARSIITQQQAIIQSSEAALAQAEQRMWQLSQASEGAASFAIESGPEADLLASINQLNAPTSFSAPGVPSPEAAQAAESSSQWQNFLEHVRDTISHYARVETAIANSPIGATTIGWTGDFDTIWIPAVAPESMTLHSHSVQLVLASRLATMRLITVVGTGAIGLVAKLTVPGGPLLVLPAAWRFVQDVMKEWKNLKAVRSGS